MCVPVFVLRSLRPLTCANVGGRVISTSLAALPSACRIDHPAANIGERGDRQRDIALGEDRQLLDQLRVGVGGFLDLPQQGKNLLPEELVIVAGRLLSSRSGLAGETRPFLLAVA